MIIVHLEGNDNLFGIWQMQGEIRYHLFPSSARQNRHQKNNFFLGTHARVAYSMLCSGTNLTEKPCSSKNFLRVFSLRSWSMGWYSMLTFLILESKSSGQVNKISYSPPSQSSFKKSIRSMFCSCQRSANEIVSMTICFSFCFSILEKNEWPPLLLSSKKSSRLPVVAATALLMAVMLVRF